MCSSHRIYTDAIEFCKSCPQCVIVTGGERHIMQPLHPITVQRSFQIIGIDIMDLSITDQDDKQVVVFRTVSLSGPWFLLCLIRRPIGLLSC